MVLVLLALLLMVLRLRLVEEEEADANRKEKNGRAEHLLEVKLGRRSYTFGITGALIVVDSTIGGAGEGVVGFFIITDPLSLVQYR
jgi:hypothetical protein